MKTLLLVDGSSYLYRAYHALPDLRTSRNEATGAIYGVINMLRRLRKDYPADYIACVFDAKGKTFRDDMYAAYKANRAAMPNDLSAQIEPLCQAIRALGWPMLTVEGVEADDVIGTLVHQANKRDMRVVISTGDKDMAQLVNANVTLINTMSNETLDEAGVLAKFGVPASAIVDYLCLIGDSVDNIPGVEKVGAKTAAKWITQYGSLNGVIAHAHEIGGTVGKNLQAALDWLPQAKRLLTIKCDCELPQTIEELAPKSQDVATLAALFERFEFRTWRRELDGDDVPPPPEAPHVEKHYRVIDTPEVFEQWFDRLDAAARISVVPTVSDGDTLTAQLVGVALALEPHEALYIPLAHRYTGASHQLPLDKVLARLKPLLEDASKPKAGHDLKFTKHVFANHGIDVRGCEHDTLLESYVLESHKAHDIDSMALRHLGHQTTTYVDVAGKGAKALAFESVPIQDACNYAAEDAEIVLQLHKTLFEQIDADGKLANVYRNIEMPLLDVLYVIERNGVRLDVAHLTAQSQALGERMLAIEHEAFDAAGGPFNLNSPKQIQEILFERLGLPVRKKTPSGTPSCDEEVLQELALDYPLPKLLLEYRGLAKLKSTYTDKLPRMVNPATGRVHTSYNQAVAVTGRLASSDPNLQNIPVRTQEGRKIREAFVASPGAHIVAADYSQIELRIMAHLSQDPAFLQAFASGEDIHRATSAEIFGVPLNEVTSEQRRYAKAINFGLIYGMSAFGVATRLGIDRAAAQLYMDRYFARYPGVADYMKRTRDAARKQGFVETVYGRRLWLPDINGGNGIRRQAAERAAINAPMQGTAADLIKLAMIEVQRWIEHQKLRTLQIMQVHDELVFEVPDDELDQVREALPALMCGVSTLSVPLVVDIGVGPNWEQAH